MVSLETHKGVCPRLILEEKPCMKTTKIASTAQLDSLLDVCFDISKAKLNVYFELGDQAFDDVWPNTTRQIERKLRQCDRLAQEHGLRGLRVVREPSGGYEKKLLQTARRLGHLTAYVNGEAVAKFRVVETNDNGKTDIKDPHIISTLARLNKTLRVRDLPEEYLLMRKCGVLYEQADKCVTRVRGHLHRSLLELFSDYSFAKDFLYTTSGRALVDKYGCNPYRIVRAGKKRFGKAMRRRAPRIRQKTLDRLWDNAVTSARHQLTWDYADLLELQLRQHYEEFLLYSGRKAAFGEQLVSLLDRLREKDPKVPEPTPGVISPKNLARLIGETGPITDFEHWRMLLRYAGLNIQMRQSGQYRGQYRVSKKGRPLLRKILALIVLPLVRRKCLYGPYYHRKRETMPGQKAMVAVMRHFLRKFHGWYRSGQAFDEQRYFTSISQFDLREAA